MNNKDLKEYLYDIYTLEDQLHTYQKIEHQYDKYIQKLKREKTTIYLYEGEERKGKNARRTNYVMPAPEFKADYLGEKRNESRHRESIYGFQGTYKMFNRLPERWKDKELERLEKQEHGKYIGLRLVIMAISIVIGLVFTIWLQMPLWILICCVIGIGICISIGDEKSKTYLPGNPYYEKYMAWYTKKYEKDLLLKKEEYNPKILFAEHEYKSLVLPKVDETKALLERVYENNIIRPEYRNYAAITQLLDYLDSKKCNALEDAYNLYEKELADEIISSNLDVSPYQMERMSGAMPMMMNSLKREEYMLEKVKEHLYSTKENRTLISYIANNSMINKEILSRYE